MTGALKGRVAVVTGAGRGIGQAIAEAFGSAGAFVMCTARTLAEIEAARDRIVAAGGKAMAAAADVTDPAAIERMYAATVGTAGGFDIVVVNAGANAERRPVAQSDPTAWRRTIEVNLIGAYHTARLAIPHLKRRGGGKIVMIGSGLGHSSRMGNSAYSVSKAGLWMLTRVLAEEVRADGIAVNELIPGPVRTAMTQGPPGPSSVMNLKEEWIKSPADVVPLAMFLATQPAEGPTGQSFSLMRRTY